MLLFFLHVILLKILCFFQQCTKIEVKTIHTPDMHFLVNCRNLYYFLGRILLNVFLNVFLQCKQMGLVGLGGSESCLEHGW